jgi:hypothetical protein
MVVDWKTLIDILPTLTGLATVLTLLFLWRQIAVANQQRKLDYDKSGIEFVLSIEGQADGFYGPLFNGPSSVIRSIYSNEIDQSWTDEQLKEYWFCRRLFGHIARMAYLIDENPGEFGMSKSEGERSLNLWLEELRIRIEASPVMRRVAEVAVDQTSWNDHIVRHTRRILKEIASGSH